MNWWIGSCEFWNKPGVAEADFGSVDTATMMKKFLTMKDPSPPIIPKGFIQALLLYQKGSSKPSYYTKGFSTLLATPEILPSWLTEEDIEYFASKFSKTGFTGGFNYYRALDLWGFTNSNSMLSYGWFRNWFYVCLLIDYIAELGSSPGHGAEERSKFRRSL